MTGDERARSVLDRFVHDELVAHPVLATALGAEGEHGALDDLSSESVLAREQACQRWAEEMAGIDQARLSEPLRIDVALVQSGLRRKVIHAEWQSWRRDPLGYLSTVLQGVHGLILHSVFPERELVSYATSRLNQVESVLAAARRNLDPDLVSPVIAGRALDQCKAAIGYFREVVPAQVDEAYRPAIAEAAERAAAASEGLVAFLEELMPRARGDYALGEAWYSKLLLEAELLGFGTRELHARGEAAWAELDEEMNELARRIDSSAGSWKPVVERLSDDRPATREAMLEAYRIETEKARRYLKERGLVSFADGEKCVVEPSAPFER
ncbi:MAG: DUF885 family protein, partial [Acidimicrobiales bacterium]